MTGRRKRWTWGGARPGAGRPREIEDRVDRTIRFERPMLDELEKLATARGSTVGALVREAVAQYVARRRKG
jgi:predicted transcriptional regulator